MMLRSIFRLKVQQVERACLFELSWGSGQQLCPDRPLPYPEVLTKLYQEWQRAYLGFYKTALRGRVAASGSLSPVDWHGKLVEAEAKLLSEFHRWLRSQELYEIRTEIARAAKHLAERVTAQPQPSSGSVDVFLTCNPIELERFPWEAWEIGREYTGAISIRFVRTPANIRAEKPPERQKFRRGKARILAILGDETGLNFQAERRALRALGSVAEVEFIGWQPGKAIAELKAQICEALVDERGWDVLFFAGHSNETALTGGELAIAPGTSLFVSEIAPQLNLARARGLKFALFNSCNGLSIAASLIDLGLSQVAVMREPIHNQVAQAFLVKFLQVLAESQDVGDALLAAGQSLKLEKNLTYPSAYLVPSLFCHPDSLLFRLEPRGLKQWLNQWLPTRREAIAVGALVLLSLFPELSDFLLDKRTFVQAVYRDLTGQLPLKITPPVLLVQIDEESLNQAGIGERELMARDYLAQIIARLSVLDAKIVGIDYILDSPQPGDPLLSQSIRTAIARKGIWFVLAAELKEGREVGVSEQAGIASPHWTIQGYTNASPQYVRLPEPNECPQTCPFAYLLAIISALKQEAAATDLPPPPLNSQSDFRTQLFNFLARGEGHNDTIAFLRQTKLHPTTLFAQYFSQEWWRPINDFSLPPDRVYDRIPAWKLLEGKAESLADYRFQQQVILIAPGGYREAPDNFSVPLAIAYQRVKTELNSQAINLEKFTGGEALAYMIHHFLTQRLVVPIPDLWALGIVAWLGKGATLVYQKRSRHRLRWAMGLASATAIYGLVALQLYISAAVLLPWFLPSAAFWIYVLPTLRKKPHG